MKPIPRDVENSLAKIAVLDDNISSLTNAVIALAADNGDRDYSRAIELIQRQIVTFANQQGEILAQVNRADGVYYRDVTEAVRAARAIEVERMIKECS